MSLQLSPVSSQKIPQKITVVYNQTTDANGDVLDKIQRFFATTKTTLAIVTMENRDTPVIPAEALETDLVMVLGGDGTVLRSACLFAAKQVPLVGVNMGKLGFLTRVDAEQLEEALQLLMAGQYKLEHRTLLHILHSSSSASSIHATASSATPSSEPLLALNDLLIKNGNPSQMGSFKVFINEQEIASYDADGVIIATPTGSTAYTLSAGGPVISPEVEAFSITPICPHSLSAKPIVIPASRTIRVEALSRNGTSIFAVDGQEVGTLSFGESITAQQAPFQMPFVTFHPEEEDFYTLLRKKLHWAMNPRWKSFQ